MKIWELVRGQVRRRGQIVATYRRTRNGTFYWKGFGMERSGFHNLENLLIDVKYFHRFRPPRLTLTFESGRKVVLP